MWRRPGLNELGGQPFGGGWDVPPGATPLGAPTFELPGRSQPTPNNGWQPSNEEIAQWGSKFDLIRPSGAVGLTEANPHRLLHASFPIPLPIYLTLAWGPTPGTPGWIDVDVIIRTSIGVGRSCHNIDRRIVAPITVDDHITLLLASRTTTVDVFFDPAMSSNFNNFATLYAGLAYIA